MPRILSQKGKVVKVSFVTDPASKRLIDMALADRQISLVDAAHAALGQYLKIKIPTSTSVAA